MEDLTGQVLKNYEIRDRIGIGGFGSVYRAFQPIVDREVAIKVILPQYANQPHFIRNFENEARLIARLEHIHIVPLYDFWRDPTGAYIVMRLLRGGSLQELLKQHGPWDPEPAATLLDQIAAALTAAHRNGIVHQDIKAANILLDEDRNAYLTDFGIAKDLKHQEMPNADGEGGEPDVLHGSPEYMSPEQILRARVDARSDIYSLGVLLYEVLTGKKPFQSKDDEELIRQQLYDSLPPLQQSRPELPEAFNVVIQRATDKNPRKRYTTPLALADNFRQFIHLSKAAGSGAGPAVIEAVERPASEIVVDPANPYKGLRAFQETDAADFFGREKLIELLHQRVRGEASAPDSMSRFLAVVGPSGSGKSSVVKAGLLPRLRAQNERWFIGEMTPGERPLQEVEAALLRVAQQPDLPIMQMLRERPDGLHAALEAALGEVTDEFVLVIDQFEEVFTMVADEAERRHFMNSLLHAVTHQDSRLRVIVTLRADFYDRPLMYSGFGTLMQRRTEVVLPMSPEELEAAIVRPAERVGLRLEDGLVAEIVNEVAGQPGTLPLLQFALTELFFNRQGNLLTVRAYRESGGVSGAMTRRAEELYASMTLEQRRFAEQIFLRLVSLGEGTEDTRRRALLQELLSMEGNPVSIRDVVDTFGRRRLLSFDIDPLSRAPTVEIAHETLIRNWIRLREWLNTNRDVLRQQRLLAGATREWIESKNDASFLATGARLTQFEALLGHPSLALNANEQAYLTSSMQKREGARLRLVGFIASLIVITFIAVGAAGLALASQQREELARRVATSRELAIRALTNTAQLDVAALLSLEAFRTADTFEARDTLLEVLQRSQSVNAHLASYLQGHTGNVRAVAISPDGARIATGGQDNTVRLWDAASLQPLGAPLVGHTNWINDLAFSPDGSLLASSSSDDTVRLWDAATGEAFGAPLTGHTGHIWSIRFSPDGRLLASASEDDSVRLWDVSTGQPLGEPMRHEGDVLALAFDPAGLVLISGGADNVLRRWDVQPESASFGQPLGEPLVGHNNWVRAVAYSPDGRFIASGGVDGRLRLWVARTGTPLETTFPALRNPIRDLAFTPQGDALATGSEDPENTVVIWNLDGTPRDVWRMPDNAAVWGLAIAPDGTRLVTASQHPAALVWDLTGGVRLGQRLRLPDQAENTLPITDIAFDTEGGEILAVSSEPTNSGSGVFIERWSLEDGYDQATEISAEGLQTRTVTDIAVSPDGRLLANALLDGEVVFTDSITGAASGAALSIGADARSVAFSHDGRWLAVGRGDGAILLWEAVEGGWQQVSRGFEGHLDRVTVLAFSPDGTLLASGSRDSTVRLWRVETGAPVGEVAAVTADDETIISLAFNPDGSLLASGDRDNTLTLWRTSDFTALRVERVHENWVTSLAFSPDGRLLASGSLDLSIILWDISDPGAMRAMGERLTGHFAGVTSLGFHPDGRSLVSAAENQSVIRWSIEPEEWGRRACKLANRSFTPLEWTAYLPDTPYHESCALRVDDRSS